MRVICAAAVVLTVTGLTSVPSAKSQQAHDSISLYAYLKSYVRTTPDVLDIYLPPTTEACTESSQFIDVDWNVDRGLQQIQIIASFVNSRSAIQTPNGAGLSASSMEARIGNWSWRRFPEPRSRTMTAGLLLGTIELGQAGRRGSKHMQIDFRLCETGPKHNLPYQGIASIRTILR